MLHVALTFLVACAGAGPMAFDEASCADSPGRRGAVYKDGVPGWLWTWGLACCADQHVVEASGHQVSGGCVTT